MTTRTYRVYGLTKKERRTGYPVQLMIGEDFEKEIKMDRLGGGVTIPTVELTRLEWLGYVWHKFVTILKCGRCKIRLKRVK